MKRQRARIAALIGAAAMTMGMGMNASAANADPNADKSGIRYTDEGISFSKKLISSAGTNLYDQVFTLKAENYHAWNLGTDSQGEQVSYPNMDDMPSLTIDTIDKGADAIADAVVGSGYADGTFSVKVPEYQTLGDYWYKLTEQQGFCYDEKLNPLETPTRVAGMIYGTNDSKTENLAAVNGGHDAVYYLHIQVMQAAVYDTASYMWTATLHQTAPAATLSDAEYNSLAKTEGKYDSERDRTTALGGEKVSQIENRYFSGDLDVKKVVTGNFGDKNRAYKVQVVFTKPADQRVDSSITFSARKEATGELTDQRIVDQLREMVKDTAEGDITWNGNTATAEFYVKDGETVSFHGIPYGVTYEVTEPDDEAEGLNYKHTFTTDDTTANPAFNGITMDADAGSAADATWAAAKATGAIADASDTVTITNEKNLPIDVGVLVKNAPYVALIALAGVVLIVVARRRKSDVE